MSEWDEQTGTGKSSTDIGSSSNFQELMESLFGKASAAPQDGGFTVAPNVKTGPPQVTSPLPTNLPGQGQQSGGALPQTPSGVPNQAPMSQPMGQTEFRTNAGARGAVASSAMSSIVNQLQSVQSQKKEENIQHAQFLYQMLKSAYESGDTTTANYILQDPKNQKLIEKFLTGKLPKVPGQPVKDMPLYGPRVPGSQEMQQRGSVQFPAKPGEYSPINAPGGVAMPKAGAGQQIGDILNATILQGLKTGDPRIVGKVFGPEAVLSKEQYAQATRAAFGMELSPAQVQAMDDRSKQLLITAKSQVLQELIQQEGAYQRAMKVAGMNDESRRAIAKMQTESRERIATAYRQMQKDVKGSAEDKMNQILWKSNGDMMRNFATSLNRSADAAEKAGNKELATTLRTQAADYAKRGSHIDEEYQNQVEIQGIIDQATLPAGEDDEGGVISVEPDDRQ